MKERNIFIHLPPRDGTTPRPTGHLSDRHPLAHSLGFIGLAGVIPNIQDFKNSRY